MFAGTYNNAQYAEAENIASSLGGYSAHPDWYATSGWGKSTRTRLREATIYYLLRGINPANYTDIDLRFPPAQVQATSSQVMAVPQGTDTLPITVSQIAKQAANEPASAPVQTVTASMAEKNTASSGYLFLIGIGVALLLLLRK